MISWPFCNSDAKDFAAERGGFHATVTNESAGFLTGIIQGLIILLGLGSSPSRRLQHMTHDEKILLQTKGTVQ